MFIASWILLVFLQNAINILAAPAPAASQTTSFSAALESLLAVLPANLTNLATNPNVPVNLLLPPKVPVTQGLHTNNANWTRKIDYKVPKTSTTLHIVLHSPGAAEVSAVVETLISLQALYLWKIEYGDRWLIKGLEDPTFFDKGFGCWLSLYSNPRPGRMGQDQHLTLTMMLSTIQGLMDVLNQESPDEQLSASLAIEDATWGLVGFGAISSVVGGNGEDGGLSPVEIVRASL